MFDLIKKSLLASLGAAVVTKEKVEQVTRKLVDEGRISVDEAERLSRELLESGQAQWEELQNKITSTIKKAIENLDIASRTDLQDLNTRVEEVEKRVSALEIPDSSGMG